MICKHCQSELPDNARFCPECGALQPMICPECGAESRPGSKVCTACGKKLPMADREDRLIYPRKKKHPLRVVSLIALVLAAILFLSAAVLFLSKTLSSTKKDPDSPPNFSEDLPETPEDPQPVVPEPDQVPVDVTPAEDEPSTDDVPAEPDEPTGDEIPAEPDDPTEEDPAADEPEEPAVDEPEAPSTEPEEPAETGYIFPDSDSRLLTQQDIQGLSAWELKVARNEIYARHGRRFNSQELQNYFDSRDWYQGTVAPGDFTDEMLSEIELANVRFLKAAE